MKMSFTTMLKKFDEKGEKTGWTYIDIPKKVSGALMPGMKKSFRVKGKIDAHQISQVALVPMGEGKFILAVNGQMRKAIKKIAGASVEVVLEKDESELQILPEFLQCLKDEPAAWKNFSKMPASHQHYYSKWIDSAKTDTTRVKRIAMAVNGLARGLDYGAMLREERDKKAIR